MALQTTIAARAGHVGEHVVAITCVSTAELGCHKFIETFGDDVHKWPLAVYVVVALLVYAAGFASARFVRRLWGARRSAEAPPHVAAPPEPVALPPAEPPPGPRPAHASRDTIIAAAGGALVVAAVVAAVAGARKG